MADQDARTGTAVTEPNRRRTDIFDGDEFDPIKFINQIYPDGALIGPGQTRPSLTWPQRARRSTMQGAPVHSCQYRPAWGVNGAGARARARGCRPMQSSAHPLRPLSAEASLGDLDRFMDVLRKQVGATAGSTWWHRGVSGAQMASSTRHAAQPARNHPPLGRQAGSTPPPRAPPPGTRRSSRWTRRSSRRCASRAAPPPAPSRTWGWPQARSRSCLARWGGGQHPQHRARRPPLQPSLQAAGGDP